MNIRKLFLYNSSCVRKHLYPLIDDFHYCLACGEFNSQRICTRCQDYLPKLRNPCQHCGVPTPHAHQRCGQCLKNPPVFESVHTPWTYASPLDKLLYNFKHLGDQCTGKALSQLLSVEIKNDYFSRHLSLPEILVAVPMSKRQQWRRGFNQAALLCTELHQSFGIPVFTALKRRHSEIQQKQLNRQQRLRNLSGCFQISGQLSGKSVAIVDDVVTTGATANTLAKALRKAGAGEIRVWALCRTPLSGYL
ncbi:MAG: ComF family protein [Cellvibrionaceae bacterium]|jgi:ComF family protein